MTNATNTPSHLNLNQSQIDRLMLGADDAQWLTPDCITQIVADPDGFTATEAREALALARDAILYASTLLKR